MKITKRQLLQMIYEETQGYGKDVLSRSWGAEGEEADPKLDYVEQTKDEDDDIRDNRDVSETRLRSILEITDHEMYASDDELRELGDKISEMVVLSRQVEELMLDMGSRYGELTALGTNARGAKQSIKELEDKYASKLDDMLRFR